MEFSEKLQHLRKKRNLTQEELAQALYVSRTAVSKWESGRGYPNIDSLKAISRFFLISIDDLLSGEEVLVIAEEDQKQKKRQFCDLLFGLLDCSTVLFLFMPFFGQIEGETVQTVSLLGFTNGQFYLKTVYLIFVIGAVVMGSVTLALQNFQQPCWLKIKSRLSLLWSTAGVMIFIISRQPYAAVFAFLMLIGKALMLIKHP